MDEIDFDAIKRKLRPHPCYRVTGTEWDCAVEDAAQFGCDWLEHLMVKIGGNVIAHAVSDLCKAADGG
jgi:hypothetical protein